ncbi:MAG: glycosyltransferase [Pseudomonadota bacterium]|nr:glycosyltransferase [Pseudomonadota bacterium]MDE3038858.1 glycosyltransferase [Pseudomonadota bacterium]
MEIVLMRPLPLGEILLRSYVITEVQLAHMLSLQQKSGGRLGDILIGQGAAGYLALYRAVADHHGLPFLDLLKDVPDPSLLHQAEADTYLRLRAIPWRRQNGCVTIAACEPSEEVAAWAKRRFGYGTRIGITSPFDIRRTVEAQFGQALETVSRLSLWENLPQASARLTLWPRQKHLLYALLPLAAAGIVFHPLAVILALIALCHLVYGTTMLFKGGIFITGMCVPPAKDWQPQLAALDEHRLPVYTVLVPMYREAASLPKLLEAMQRLDYPASKLDIKLAIEADDTETLNAAMALKPHYHFDIVRVPPSALRTKPKACNYALRFARGEFVTVFDADDRPERFQLKKAVLAFRALPPDVACLQARLNYYNADDNWLTRFFSLEYTVLFHFLLYGLERLGIPIPLGGTSNHISLARLKDLGEWDPFNVTEDADLGTRLAAQGFKTVMLDSFTMEEAPRAPGAWLNQRSRWIKGYMQTWLVHMRHPGKLWRNLGWKGFLGFQCFVGLPGFAFLTAPILWALPLLWLGGLMRHSPVFPQWLGWLTSANLLLSLFTQWYSALFCALFYRRSRRRMAAAALLYPLYLLLHSLASYKALWQLIVKPHFWEKTVHGELFCGARSAAVEDDLLRLKKSSGGIPLTEARVSG